MLDMTSSPPSGWHLLPFGMCLFKEAQAVHAMRGGKRRAACIERFAYFNGQRFHGMPAAAPARGLPAGCVSVRATGSCAGGVCVGRLTAASAPTGPPAYWPTGLPARQLVAGAAPAAGRFLQHAPLQQLRDVAQRGVGRALGDGCPLAAAELALEAVEQAIQQFDLPFVQRCARPALPEARLDQHCVQRGLRAGHCAHQRAEEPRQPAGDIERALLYAFEHVVVVLALALDLRRQAVEALRTAVGSGEEQVAYGAGDATIAGVERVQCHEPEVCEACFHERRLAGFLARPRPEFITVDG